jgi:hypothetical protein
LPAQGGFLASALPYRRHSRHPNRHCVRPSCACLTSPSGKSWKKVTRLPEKRLGILFCRSLNLSIVRGLQGNEPSKPLPQGIGSVFPGTAAAACTNGVSDAEGPAAIRNPSDAPKDAFSRNFPGPPPILTAEAQLVYQDPSVPSPVPRPRAIRILLSAQSIRQHAGEPVLMYPGARWGCRLRLYRRSRRHRPGGAHGEPSSRNCHSCAQRSVKCAHPSSRSTLGQAFCEPTLVEFVPAWGHPRGQRGGISAPPCALEGMPLQNVKWGRPWPPPFALGCYQIDLVRM